MYFSLKKKKVICFKNYFPFLLDKPNSADAVRNIVAFSLICHILPLKPRNDFQYICIYIFIYVVLTIIWSHTLTLNLCISSSSRHSCCAQIITTDFRRCTEYYSWSLCYATCGSCCALTKDEKKITQRRWSGRGGGVVGWGL